MIGFFTGFGNDHMHGGFVFILFIDFRIDLDRFVFLVYDNWVFRRGFGGVGFTFGCVFIFFIGCLGVFRLVFFGGIAFVGCLRRAGRKGSQTAEG
ncbi:MAG: hypothetical protein ACLVLI_05260 [Aedoeadaptatus pacaensis]